MDVTVGLTLSSLSQCTNWKSFGNLISKQRARRLVFTGKSSFSYRQFR
ncbi:hypothetical protein LEP1GSC195_3345 [Leptospira wolbachii serovar Codice str. CDC]|uniref:Uncharacterized protein n=1 Tax=Leptospira wolbachii serovar Codice str. CDC TaxID=1218599 RepID=R9A2S1_9LEPT|nr:hypothetical protein LEP1GSC195_3345 [Leptospira wolbachii serovar Codice str. CDC]